MSSRGIQKTQTDMDEQSKMLVGLPCQAQRFASVSLTTLTPQSDAKSKIQEALSSVEKSDEKDIAAYIKKKLDEDYGPTVRRSRIH